MDSRHNNRHIFWNKSHYMILILIISVRQRIRFMSLFKSDSLFRKLTQLSLLLLIFVLIFLSWEVNRVYLWWSPIFLIVLHEPIKIGWLPEINKILLRTWKQFILTVQASEGETALALACTWRNFKNLDKLHSNWSWFVCWKLNVNLRVVSCISVSLFQSLTCPDSNQCCLKEYTNVG